MVNHHFFIPPHPSIHHFVSAEVPALWVLGANAAVHAPAEATGDRVDLSHETTSLFSRALESWFILGKSSPFMAARFSLVKYYILPRYMVIWLIWGFLYLGFLSYWLILVNMGEKRGYTYYGSYGYIYGNICIGELVLIIMGIPIVLVNIGIPILRLLW